MYGGVTQVQPTNDVPGYLRVENSNSGARFVFTFTSDVEADAALAVYVSPKPDDYYLHNVSNISVNGGAAIAGTTIVKEDPDLPDNHWASTYTKLDIGMIAVDQGDNTVSFTTKGYGGLKIDRIELRGDALAA